MDLDKSTNFEISIVRKSKFNIFFHKFRRIMLNSHFRHPTTIMKSWFSENWVISRSFCVKNFPARTSAHCDILAWSWASLGGNRPIPSGSSAPPVPLSWQAGRSPCVLHVHVLAIFLLLCFAHAMLCTDYVYVYKWTHLGKMTDHYAPLGLNRDAPIEYFDCTLRPRFYVKDATKTHQSRGW